MRRKDREMSEKFAWVALDRCNYATFAVTDLNGRPYSVPMLFARKDRSIYYHSFSQGRMFEIMKTEPEVCINAVPIAAPVPTTNELAFASVIVFGKAHVVEDDEEKIMAMTLMQKKLSPDNMAAFGRGIPFSLTHLGVVRIDVTEITAKANLPGLMPGSPELPA